MTGTRVCHSCGISLTLKGMPLKGNYCSPLCKDRNQAMAHDRETRIGRGPIEYGGRMGSGFFDSLFDSHNDHNNGDDGDET